MGYFRVRVIIRSGIFSSSVTSGSVLTSSTIGFCSSVFLGFFSFLDAFSFLGVFLAGFAEGSGSFVGGAMVLKNLNRSSFWTFPSYTIPS